MEPKTLLPTLWRRAKQQSRPEAAISKEVDVNQPSAPPAEAGSVKQEQMLSYEDIYRAAGIMNPVLGYGIHKVVAMLNSERIRDLSNEIKRASVLMALDAAGASLDEVLQDATRRQQALTAYESAKRKQLDDFEAAKTRENAHIEEEMERVRAHYAERMQRNRDLIAEEKEALRNWQMATQHEVQRITEVMELCGRPAASAQPNVASVAADGATSSENKQPGRTAAAGQSH